MVRELSNLVLLVVAVLFVLNVGCDSTKQSSSSDAESTPERVSGTSDQRVAKIEQWLADLQGPDRVAREIAADSLKSLSAEDVGAVPMLIDGLDSTDVNVRRFSAHALGAIGAPARAALQPLIDSTLKAGGDWQYTALPVVKIAQNDQASVETVAESFRSATGEARFRMLWIAAELDPPVESLAPEFAKELESSNPQARKQAVLALAGFGKTIVSKYVRQLTALFGDDDFEVRKMAISAISSAAPQTTEAFEALQKLLVDPDPEIQRAAAIALAMFGAEASNALEQLVALAESKDKDTRIAALIAIGQTGHAGSAYVDRLKAGLEHPDERIRQVTVQTLIQIAPDHEATVQGVIAGLNENSEVSRSIVLGTIGDQFQDPAPAIVDRLLESMEDPRELTRINTMEVILKLAQRSEGVRKRLVAQLNSSDRVQETLWSEAMIAVVRRNQEYAKIGLQERSQEVLDAFESVRAEASKLPASTADRVTTNVAQETKAESDVN